MVWDLLNIFRFDDQGRLVEEWVRTDHRSVLRQLGVDAAERDADVATIHGRIQRGYARPFQEVIARAKRNGEISASVDSAAMIAALIGPLFYRRWFSRESLDTGFVKDVVKRAIEFAKPRTSPHRRSKRSSLRDQPAV